MLQINWDLKIKNVVFKELKKIPEQNVEVIWEAIRFLKSNPYFGDIQKIKGEVNTWRKRVGSYRIFYEIYTPEHLVVVFNIERRSSNTY